jgi:hypothetical protein
MTTPVIFRKFKEGDIIAMFPTFPGDMNPNTCSSYQHLGQHGAATIDLIYGTKPATEQEYKDLLEELVSIGYDDLKIYQKNQYWMTQERIKELNRTR